MTPTDQASRPKRTAMDHLEYVFTEIMLAPLSIAKMR